MTAAKDRIEAALVSVAEALAVLEDALAEGGESWADHGHKRSARGVPDVIPRDVEYIRAPPVPADLLPSVDRWIAAVYHGRLLLGPWVRDDDQHGEKFVRYVADHNRTTVTNRGAPDLVIVCTVRAQTWDYGSSWGACLGESGSRYRSVYPGRFQTFQGAMFAIDDVLTCQGAILTPGPFVPVKEEMVRVPSGPLPLLNMGARASVQRWDDRETEEAGDDE